MPEQDQVEERSVEKAELQAGVTLKAGHPVILLVGGVPGGPTDPTGPEPTGTEPTGGEATGGEPTGDEPTGGTGTGEPTGGEPTGGTGTGEPTGGTGTGEPTGGEPTGGTGTGEPTGGEPTGGTGTGEPTGSEPTGGTGTSPPGPTPSMMAAFDAAHFETDRAFPLAEAIPTFQDIATFSHKEPHRVLLVVGHTDAVGDGAYNLGLSGDRANSVSAYLRNDVDAWMKFYDSAPSSKKWGTIEDQHMLAALPWGGSPFLKRKPVDVMNADVTKAIKDYQRSKKVPDTGTMDKATRRLLVFDYMAADGTTTPADAQIQTLSCGERHLKEKTQAASQINRRVEVFAFESSDIRPPTDDCRKGKHPGCTAYDEWVKAAEKLPKGDHPAPKPTPKPAPEPAVDAISGPAKITVGKEARYAVTRGAGKGAKWVVEVPGAAPAPCEGDTRFVIANDGMTIKAVPGQWNNLKIVIRAGDTARAVSTVSLEPLVLADSWTPPDTRNHRPGVGPDFTSGDFTVEQYAELGDFFKLDTLPGGLARGSDDQAFAAFRSMAQTLFTHGELTSNTDAMIDKFRKNEGGPWESRTYSNASLTKIAREHESTKRFVAALGKALRDGIRDAGGDAGQVKRFKQIASPVYNTAADKWDGLTIAINDTWAFEATLIDYELTAPKAYRARMRVVIYDHFGLDVADLKDKAIRTMGGFRAWFLLQHVRGYRPFVTKLEFEEVFEGSL